MRDSILKAAAAVREDIEAFAMYWSMAHGAEINIRRMENGQVSLLGACALASWVMWRALKRAGHSDAEMIAGWYQTFEDESGDHPFFGAHCWVTVEGQLLDLTATQFGHPASVYVTDPGEDKNYTVLDLHVLYSAESYRIRKWMAGTGADAEMRLMEWDSQSPFRSRYRPDLQVIEDRAVKLLEAA